MGRQTPDVLDDSAQRLVAELTVTAHDVALRHGRGGSFVDLQLALWDALGRVVRQQTATFAAQETGGAPTLADRLDSPGLEDRLFPRPEDRLCCCT